MALPHALWQGYSVDRIDNNGPYAPENVKWSTAAQQRMNQRRQPWPFGVLAHEKDDAIRQAREQENAEGERLYRLAREKETAA